ncbi:MAG TPA: amino acid adenylation domain-containing protein, partial [Longimicrobium sp.]|nr:amino acid adenylation domain-containing protein [Longimicrobium sp.]
GVEAAVRRTHALLADLLRHEHASLALAQRCSGVVAPAPLFTSLLNFRHGVAARGSQQAGQAGQPGEGVRHLVVVERTNYPVAVIVDDHGEEFSLTAQVAAPAEAERVCRIMHTALERLVEALEVDPGRASGSIDVLPEAERRQVVEAWNRTDAEYPADRCIHELFEAQVERTPDATAVAFEGERLTCAELNRRANRLAHHLRSLGVGPDVRVGICVERGPEMVVGFLGVLKAGGAYVPLNPGQPAERLSYMLADSAPAVVLTQQALRDRVEKTDVPVLEIDADRPEWADQAATDPVRAGLTPGHLAYVIYTSGSTGRPKGVLGTHRAMVNRLAWGWKTYPYGPGEVVAQKTSIGFVDAVAEIFGPLLAGVPLAIIGDAAAREPERLMDALAAEGCTRIVLVPSLLRAMLEAAPELGARVPALRTWVCSGERLDAELCRAFARAVPDGVLINLYGSSEVAADVTCFDTRALGEDDGAVPIGRPIANTRIYVLDAALRPVPAGVPGEICAGGDGVARGYLDRPGLTAERFVPDPFAARPGARMYRTGDRGRFRQDGTLLYLGRADHQVKLRGMRIELGEVEAVLAAHPAVRLAVVDVRELVPGEPSLAAWIVAENGAAPASAELEGWLRERLPDYMVPGAIVSLEALPLGPTGKLDRRALPAPRSTAAAWESPRTQVEEVLAGIWAEVLRAERVGAGDHFFALGGHSLLAVRVVSRVRHLLGVEVPLAELFRSPVLSDLARAIENAARTELPPIERVERSDRLPLSFAQQRLWFLEQFGDLGGAYHIPMRLPLQGELDQGALGRALDAIVARHEALRTTFVEVEGEPVQRIAPAEESRFPLAEHDLIGDPQARSALRRLVGEEARAPFDLARGPLIRGRLIRMSQDDHLLLVTMHHIVSDGWSLGVFTRELGALYDAFRRGEPDPLPALPVQYADYAAWQRRWVDGDVLKEQAEYWTETLAGAPALLELPTDHPRPAEVDHAGASMGVELDEALTAGLKALGQRHGTTLFMTVLAGWAAVLGRLSGQEDVVVGTPTANRGRIEIEGLIGFFVNTLALRVDLAGSPSVGELLGRVRERALGAQQNQDIPFEQVVELVQPARSMAHSPLFQVMFGWHNASSGGLELPGLTLGSAGSPGSAGSAGSTRSTGSAGLAELAGLASEAAAKFDLSLDLLERDGRIVGSVTYATSLFERATVERQVGYLRLALEAMVADERQPVDRLALLPEHERRQVVEAWNATDAEYPADWCIHELFEAQVERTPDATAVAFEGRSLTCAELNARANRLAHHLRSLGVGPDVRVGICVERGLEMVVAFLGVLKAGGAYVPLDPGQPAERLSYMLAESAPAVVLTQQALRDRVGKTDVPVLEIDADSPEWADRPATDPAIEGLTPAHLAYVIYTSGSTGRPKGVLGTHRAMVNRLAWGWEAYPYGPGEVVAQKTSIGFVDAVAEIFGPLLAGVPLAVIGDAAAREPERLMDALAAEGCTRIVLVPSLLRAMLDAAPELGARVPALRTWVCSGERLDAELCRAFARAVPDGVLVNLYGSSEVAADVTCFDTRALGEDEGAVPIGRPIANTRIYVMDAALRPVPAGVPGEICAGGDGVARGYLDRPGLTAERFVPDPFAARPG